MGGSGDNVLIGGPGNDHLIGGDGFDDVSGGKGSDVVLMGGDFDRFTWKPGDGTDVVDGGASRDSLSFTGTNDGEAYALDPDGRGLRFTVGDVALALAGIEEIDPVLGAGEDTFAIGDLSRTGAQLVDISLAPLPITPLGDFNADRITVAGTDKADALKLTGKVVTSGTATLTVSPGRSTSATPSPSTRSRSRRRRQGHARRPARRTPSASSSPTEHSPASAPSKRRRAPDPDRQVQLESARPVR